MILLFNILRTRRDMSVEEEQERLKEILAGIKEFIQDGDCYKAKMVARALFSGMNVAQAIGYGLIDDIKVIVDEWEKNCGDGNEDV